MEPPRNLFYQQEKFDRVTLFILCSEVLYGLCRVAQEKGDLPGITITKQSLRFNHLLFADDTIFFCKTNRKSVKALKNILKLYQEASGQKINCQKSAITFSSKAPQDIKDKVQRELNIPKERGLGKYMGLLEHLAEGKKNFSMIVDKIRQ